MPIVTMVHIKNVIMMKFKKKCYKKRFIKKKFLERNDECVKCLIFINVKLSKNKLLLINPISLYLKYIYNKFL